MLALICPASPDLLAITHADAAAVQLWRFPSARAAMRLQPSNTELSGTKAAHGIRTVGCFALPFLTVQCSLKWVDVPLPRQRVMTRAAR